MVGFVVAVMVAKAYGGATGGIWALQKNVKPTKLTRLNPVN